MRLHTGQSLEGQFFLWKQKDDHCKKIGSNFSGKYRKDR